MYYYFLPSAKKDKETTGLEQWLEEEKRHYEQEQKYCGTVKCEVEQIKVNDTSLHPTIEYSPSYDL
jgi:hypothetical protein